MTRDPLRKTQHPPSLFATSSSLPHAPSCLGPLADDDDPTLDELDHELDAQLLDAPPHAPPDSSPSLTTSLTPAADDQAAALRALVDASTRLPQPPRPAFPRSNPATPTPDPTTPGRVVAIVSGKGGVGKTFLSVNLAGSLSRLGRSVILADADLGTANADILCGRSASRRLEHAVGHASQNDSPSSLIASALIPISPGFCLVPGASGVARVAELSPAERASLVHDVHHLRSLADLVLIDTAAGVGPDVSAFAAPADLTLIVTTPEPTAITDAYAFIKCMVARHPDACLPIRGRHRFMFVVNQALDAADARAVHARLAAASHKFLGIKPPLLGWIAHDLRVQDSIRDRTPLYLSHPRTQASLRINTLAQSLLDALGIALPDPTPRAASIIRTPRIFRLRPRKTLSPPPKACPTC